MMSAQGATSGDSISMALDSVDQLNIDYDRQRRRVVEERAAIDKLKQLLGTKQLELQQLQQLLLCKQEEALSVQQQLPTEQAKLRHAQSTLVTLRRTSDLLHQQTLHLQRQQVDMCQQLKSRLDQAQLVWTTYQQVYNKEVIFAPHAELRNQKQLLQEASDKKIEIEHEISLHISDVDFIVKMTRLSLEFTAIEQAMKKSMANTARSSEESQLSDHQLSQTSGGFSVPDVVMDDVVTDDANRNTDQAMARSENVSTISIEDSQQHQTSTSHQSPDVPFMDTFTTLTSGGQVRSPSDKCNDKNKSNLTQPEKIITKTSSSVKVGTADRSNLNHKSNPPVLASSSGRAQHKVATQQAAPSSVASDKLSQHSSSERRVSHDQSAVKRSTYRTYWMPLPNDDLEEDDCQQQPASQSQSQQRQQCQSLSDNTLTTGETKQTDKSISENKSATNKALSTEATISVDLPVKRPLSFGTYQTPKIHIRKITRPILKPLTFSLDKCVQQPATVPKSMEPTPPAGDSSRSRDCAADRELATKAADHTRTELAEHSASQVCVAADTAGTDTHTVTVSDSAGGHHGSDVSVRPIETDNASVSEAPTSIADAPKHSTPLLPQVRMATPPADISILSEPSAQMETSFDLNTVDTKADASTNRRAGFSLLFGAGDSNTDQDMSDFSFNFGNTGDVTKTSNPTSSVFSFF